MISLTESKQINPERNSSKGNQLKWLDGECWYKADYLGYEALVEYLVSKLLQKTNVSEFVEYDIVNIQYKKKNFMGCYSKNFLDDGEELITLEKLFRQYKGIDWTQTYALLDVKQRISFVVNGVEEITGLKQFGKYLTMLMEMDALFLNEDRHTHNIAVIRKKDKTFAYAPVFDNGVGLFSDTRISYELDLPLQECYQLIEAKPFNRSFDIQVDAAEALYGSVLKYWFTMNDVQQLLEEARAFYEPRVIQRVEDVMGLQLHKYQYMHTNKTCKSINFI